MHQLRINKALNMNVHVLSKTKKMKKFKKAYDICSMFYFIIFKNIIELIEQNNEMSTKNDVASKNSRIQIQISQILF